MNPSWDQKVVPAKEAAQSADALLFMPGEKAASSPAATAVTEATEVMEVAEGVLRSLLPRNLAILGKSRETIATSTAFFHLLVFGSRPI